MDFLSVEPCPAITLKFVNPLLSLRGDREFLLGDLRGDLLDGMLEFRGFPYLSKSPLLSPDSNLFLIGDRLLGEGDLLPGNPPNPLLLGGDLLGGDLFRRGGERLGGLLLLYTF